MILEKCKQTGCVGFYVSVLWQGKDKQNQHILRCQCSLGHYIIFSVATSAPTTFTRAAKFPASKGEWFPATNKPGEHHPSIGCPKCGNMAGAGPPIHSVNKDDKVTPSYVCPYDACDFHAHITVKGWNDYLKELRK